MDSEEIIEKIEDVDEAQTKPIRLTPTGKISHAKTRVYTQRYRKEWETTPDFKDWLTSVPFQATRAFCKFCQRNLHAHRLSLLKHMCTLKHQRAAVQYAKKQEDETQNGREGQDHDNYVIEQIDTEEDEEDDENNYDDTDYIHGDDEEHIFEEQEEEIVESEIDDSPAYKKIRIENDDGQDTLAQAIADVDPDLIHENHEEIQFEMVNDADSNKDVPEHSFQIVKCESLSDSKTDQIDVNSKNTNTVKESKVVFSMDTSKTTDSPVVDSEISSTSLHGKKVILLSTGGKSFTVMKGKLPQFLLNQASSNNVVKRDKIELKTVKDTGKDSICTFPSTSQEFTNKINYSKTLAMTTKSILMKKPTISTNVLETSKGIPVSGLQIILYKLDDGRWKNIQEGYTSANGTYDFSNSSRNNLTVGRYRLHYDVEKYYSLKKVTTVYPFIEIVFDVKDPGATYNIPLLMSPFSYSTFKDFPR